MTLADLGYWVIRMGKIVAEPFAVSHPRIVDYPHSGARSDLLDVFLGANCAFYLSSGSGIDSVATVFRRPQLLVNFPLPFHPLTWRSDHLFIYQHFRDSGTGEPLSLRDLALRQAQAIFSTEEFEKAHISLTRNSQDEIRAAALEMHERVSGTWQEEPDDVRLQEEFWRSFTRFPEIHGDTAFKARIGRDFLAQNRYLVRK